MKKIIITISLLFILTGCGPTYYEDAINEPISNNQVDENIEEENKYIDNNPIKVALYDDYNKITNYSTTLANFKDIGVFNIYYTDIDKLDSNNIKNNYELYYNQYENIENYKTGFYITFEAEGNKIEQLVLNPNNQHSMTPYLYVYLYDDINQTPGTYYSHLEPKDMKDNTIYSSIKLFLAQEGSKISSPITLTVFTYDEDDFTEDKKYRGNSSYTITIDTK